MRMRPSALATRHGPSMRQTGQQKDRACSARDEVVAAGGRGARGPEVGDAHAPVGAQQQVVRLQVAMHHARSVVQVGHALRGKYYMLLVHIVSLLGLPFTMCCTLSGTLRPAKWSIFWAEQLHCRAQRHRAAYAIQCPNGNHNWGCLATCPTHSVSKLPHAYASSAYTASCCSWLVAMCGSSGMQGAVLT